MVQLDPREQNTTFPNKTTEENIIKWNEKWRKYVQYLVSVCKEPRGTTVQSPENINSKHSTFCITENPEFTPRPAKRPPLPTPERDRRLAPGIGVLIPESPRRGTHTS